MSGGVEDFVITSKDISFKLPFGMIISGSSSSGKTSLLLRILAHADKLITPIPAQIVYAYGEYNKDIPSMKKAGISIVSGLPSEEFIDACKKPLLLILDDLMVYAKDTYLQNLFTKKSHHQNIGVIFITQNLFDKNVKVARKNTHYIILTRAPNSALDISNIGRQLFPNQVKQFIDSYNQATKEQYGYLLIDMHPSTNKSLRLRTKIFPDELQEVFILQG